MREFPTVTERSPAKIPTTTVTNELARAVRQLAPVLVGGQQISPWSPREVWGVITNKGPRGETEDPDYIDERYWVRLSFIDGTNSLTSEPALHTTHITTSYEATEWSTGQELPPIITATNLAELRLDKEEGEISVRQAGTHLLVKGTRVVVRCSVDAIGNARYTFCHPVQILVEVTSAATGGGKYKGRFIIPDVGTAPVATGNLTIEELGRIPANNEEILIFNAAEVGQDTHDLTEGMQHATIFPGVLLARTMAATETVGETHVVVINGYDWESCSTSGSESEASYI